MTFILFPSLYFILQAQFIVMRETQMYQAEKGAPDTFVLTCLQSYKIIQKLSSAYQVSSSILSFPIWIMSGQEGNDCIFNYRNEIQPNENLVELLPES